LAYTRGILDPSARPRTHHKRLTELLSIGSVTAPVIAGKHYFYTRREACRTSPCCTYAILWRELTESSSTPTNLPPTAPSPSTGSNPAKTASTSPTARRPADQKFPRSRSLKPKPANSCPTPFERTRAASIAWKHDNSGFYYTRYPKKGDVPAGQEMYNRHVFYTNSTLLKRG